MKHYLILIFIFLLFLLGTNSHNIRSNSYLYSYNENWRPTEVLVKLKEDSKVYKFQFSENFDLDKIIKDYEAEPEVEYAEKNWLYKSTLLEPNDEKYPYQWYLPRIQAPEAWEKITGSTEIIIAIIDSGVDIDHPDLKENIWKNYGEVFGDGIDNDGNGYIDDVYGWDFVSQSFDPNPKFEPGYTEIGINHGTVVAGVVAARGNNGIGITGVTWQSKIMPLRALDSSGIGDTLTVSKAIDYAIDMGADIINLSFVGPDESQTLKEAIEKAYRAGILIVAAVGNEEKIGHNLEEKPMYPVCHETEEENMVLGVVAIDEKNKKALFSNYGKKCVDIAAPGTRFYGTQVYEPSDLFEKYYGGYWSGTSLAAPLVAGVGALLKSLNPDLSVDEMRDIIIRNADQIDDFNPEYKGKLGGRLNAFKAVEAVLVTLKEPVIEEKISPPQKPGVEVIHELPLPKSFKIIVAPETNYSSQIKVGAIYELPLQKDFFAYHKDFSGGVNIASGDVDGDGISEIITGAGPGGGPHVRIFDLNGTLKSQFFAYDSNFRGGVNVASGDLDGDGISEIITGAGPGGGPHVRIFDINGTLKSQFFAYDPKFSGGVNVASGDTDGDGRSEIITGAGPGGGPHVRIFDINGTLKSQFFAYDPKFSGGVNVASGDEMKHTVTVTSKLGSKNRIK